MNAPQAIQHERKTHLAGKGLRNFVLVWLASIFLVALTGWVFYGPSGRDDVYKTYWPAQQLAAEGVLGNYNAEPVEQSSSLLHVLLLAGLLKIGLGTAPAVALAMSLLWAGLACALAWSMAKRLELGGRLSAPATLALLPATSYWAWSGMETTLGMAALAAFVYSVDGLIRGRGWAMLVVSALAVVLSRPEAGLVAFVGLGIAWTFCKEAEGRKTLLKAGLLIAVLSLCLASVRLFWTGSPFPQPVAAKATLLDPARWRGGASYLFHESLRQPVWILIGLGAITGLTTLRKKGAGILLPLLAGLSVSGAAFVVFSGGDWMENGRFLLSIAPFALLLALSWVGGIKRRWQMTVPATLLLACLIGLPFSATRQSTGSPIWNRHASTQEGFHWTERMNRVHARDLRMIGLMRAEVDSFQSAKKRKPVVLSQQAGMVMYHLSLTHRGQFRFIDLVGLCTRDFTDCALTNQRGSTFGGIMLDIPTLFGMYPQITAQCGIPRPDIIFDLDNERRSKQRFLETQGYAIIWSDSGMVGNGNLLELGNGQFIARGWHP